MAKRNDAPTPITRFDARAWLARYAEIQIAVEATRERIDELSDADYLPDDVDEKICYAANQLEGTAALLREAAEMVKRQAQAASGSWVSHIFHPNYPGAEVRAGDMVKVFRGDHCLGEALVIELDNRADTNLVRGETSDEKRRWYSPHGWWRWQPIYKGGR